jgi:hypothetical protein
MLKRKVSPLDNDFVKRVQSRAIEVHRKIEEVFHRWIYVQPVIVFTGKFARLRFYRKQIPNTNVFAVRSEWLNSIIQEFSGVSLSEVEVQSFANYFRKYCQK